MTRYSMYKRLSEVGSRIQPLTGDALCISHSTHLLQLMSMQPSKVVEANYPECRMTQLPFADAQFDMVMSDQVLEHVQGDPLGAVEETRRILRPGGIAVHTTVFNFPIHGAPGDYWRYTPDALRYLCRDFTEIIECDGWGSYDAWRWSRRGLHFERVPHATWHPLHKIATLNDPEWPIVTWIVARK